MANVSIQWRPGAPELGGAPSDAEHVRRRLISLLRTPAAPIRDLPRFEWEGVVSGARRPGRGGRQPRIDRTYLTEATQDLVEQLGTPQVVTDKGATLMLWELDEAGDGAIVARLSGDDLRKGETAFGQVHELRALAARVALNPRWLLVGLRLSGKRPYGSRLDFQFLEHAIERHGLGWVAYTNPDRIARHGFAHETFYARLQELKVGLYLVSLGRRVDWEQDRLYLQITGVLSEHDRNRLVSRMADAREATWPLAGRGWPSSQFIGLMRDERAYFVVDPVQWPFVERIHYDYPRFSEYGSGGLRGLAEHLTALGCPMSRDLVRTVLSNRIYVDGKWSVRLHGGDVAQRTVDLAKPIPLEVFERNQEFLALGRRRGRANEGCHILSGVPIMHAPCEGEIAPNGKAIRLKVSMDYGRYYHWPASPACCRGYALDAAAVEDAVIEALLQLARDTDLQTAWSEAAADRWPPREALRSDDVDVLTVRRRRLMTQRDRMVRQWLDHTADETTAAPFDAYVAATRHVDQEIEALDRRIALADAQKRARDERAQRTEDVRDGLTEEMLRLLRPEPGRPAWRRRAHFVRSVLSRVVVHDDNEGLPLKLEGPLVPRDCGPIVVDPLGALAGHGFSPGRESTGWPTGEKRPAWVSPVIRLDPRSSGQEHDRLWLRLLDCVRAVDQALPAGSLGSRRFRGTWDEMAAAGLLPKRRHWEWRPLAGRISAREIVIIALGRERAFRMQRARPRSLDDIELVFRMAVADGLELAGSGWCERIRSARATLPYIPSPHGADLNLLRQGTRLSEVRDRILRDG